jgi:hypothetical protein
VKLYADLIWQLKPSAERKGTGAQKTGRGNQLAYREWLRIAFAQFLSSESRSLMGIRDLAEFKWYAINRFRGIVYAVVKISRKTNSPIPP